MKIRVTPGTNVAIYRQIADQLRRAIATGELAIGENLPSVRALAKDLVINPNTVAKAYADLTRDGLIDSQPGRGLFVAKKRTIYTKTERNRRIDEALDQLISESIALDIAPDELIDRMRQRLDSLKLSDARAD